MKVTRTSTLSGKTSTMELDVTEEQLAAYENGRVLIQDVFPNLSRSERDFIKLGITPKEWKEQFGEDEEDRELTTKRITIVILNYETAKVSVKEVEVPIDETDLDEFLSSTEQITSDCYYMAAVGNNPLKIEIESEAKIDLTILQKKEKAEG